MLFPDLLQVLACLCICKLTRFSISPELVGLQQVINLSTNVTTSSLESFFILRCLFYPKQSMNMWASPLLKFYSVKIISYFSYRCNSALSNITNKQLYHVVKIPSTGHLRFSKDESTLFQQLKRSKTMLDCQVDKSLQKGLFCTSQNKVVTLAHFLKL